MMTEDARAALDAYFSEGDSWASDRAEALDASRRTAWRIATGASIVALCEALALMSLAPLKTAVPYTLMVDRQTGFVQKLDPLAPGRTTADRALTESFLVQYVIAREGYDFDALQSDYRKVALWSAGRARAEYLSAIDPSNPSSVAARLPRSSVIDVHIKSVTALADNVAMVRFETIGRDGRGGAGAAGAWTSVIRYSYSGAPMSAEDRLFNPLGFQVLRYRRSAEIPPPPEVRRLQSDEGDGRSG